MSKEKEKSVPMVCLWLIICELVESPLEKRILSTLVEKEKSTSPHDVFSNSIQGDQFNSDISQSSDISMIVAGKVRSRLSTYFPSLTNNQDAVDLVPGASKLMCFDLHRSSVNCANNYHLTAFTRFAKNEEFR